MLKLHHLLEQEADELKRLLGAKAGMVGNQVVGAAESATRATLARLKTDLASRRLHEASVSTSEVRATMPVMKYCFSIKRIGLAAEKCVSTW